MIPAVSTASDMVFVNGWYDNAGWEITGLDWATGKTRHQVNLGKSNPRQWRICHLAVLPEW